MNKKNKNIKHRNILALDKWNNSIDLYYDKENNSFLIEKDDKEIGKGNGYIDYIYYSYNKDEIIYMIENKNKKEIVINGKKHDITNEKITAFFVSDNLEHLIFITENSKNKFIIKKGILEDNLLTKKISNEYDEVKIIIPDNFIIRYSFCVKVLVNGNFIFVAKKNNKYYLIYNKNNNDNIISEGYDNIIAFILSENDDNIVYYVIKNKNKYSIIKQDIQTNNKEIISDDLDAIYNFSTSKISNINCIAIKDNKYITIIDKKDPILVYRIIDINYNQIGDIYDSLEDAMSNIIDKENLRSIEQIDLNTQEVINEYFFSDL